MYTVNLSTHCGKLTRSEPTYLTQHTVAVCLILYNTSAILNAANIAMNSGNHLNVQQEGP